MTVAVEQVALRLRVPLETLMQESVKAYVAQQERFTELDIADLRDRYNVPTPEELVARIEAGEIYSHPAWEDSIEWEHLNAHLKQLSELRAMLN